MSISTFEADLAAMRETREQMAQLREGLETQTRWEQAVASMSRAVFGDEEYHREALAVALQEVMARKDPPPAPGVRAKLRRNWGWWKRMGR